MKAEASKDTGINSIDAGVEETIPETDSSASGPVASFPSRTVPTRSPPTWLGLWHLVPSDPGRLLAYQGNDR